MNMPEEFTVCSASTAMIPSGPSGTGSDPHVNWLYQVGLDITCVRLQPYNVDGSVFVERTQILPMPESADYMVRLRDRE